VNGQGGSWSALNWRVASNYPPPRLPGALGGGRSDTRGGSAAQSRAKDRELIAAVTVSRLNS